MRVKAKWNYKGKEHTLDETASAVAFTIWRIGQQILLNLENADFETNTRAQRMDVVGEVAAFATHLADRIAYERLGAEERAQFINAVAKYLANTMEDNRRDVEPEGDHRGQFIALLNERTDAYADCPFDDKSGPGFSMSRTLGDHISEKMGERDRKWITQQVMDVEVPEAYKTLKRAMYMLFGWSSPESAVRPAGAVRLGDD